MAQFMQFSEDVVVDVARQIRIAIEDLFFKFSRPERGFVLDGGRFFAPHPFYSEFLFERGGAIDQNKEGEGGDVFHATIIRGMSLCHKRRSRSVSEWENSPLFLKGLFPILLLLVTC